jgi:hypothetical protein
VIEELRTPDLDLINQVEQPTHEQQLIGKKVVGLGRDFGLGRDYVVAVRLAMTTAY